MSGWRLDADALLQRACEETGAEPGTTDYLTGLRVLVAALADEADLTDLGRAVAEGQLLATLRTRLRAQEWARANAALLAQERVERPVFLVGIPRSGTTALSHLLSRDPANRSLLGWEANDPVPPPLPDAGSTDPRAIAARDGGPSLVEKLNPRFAAIHHDPWDMPVECVVVLSQHFVSLTYSAQYRVPSYTRWVLDADHRGAYEWHCLVLRVLQSAGRRGRWQLKSPHHALSIDALAAQYPDARFVVTHRDPADCVASTCSLHRSLSSTFANPDTGTEEHYGSLWTDVISAMTERVMAARDRLGEHRFVDVAYRDVRDDPMRALRQIYADIGDELSDGAVAAMEAHAAVAVPNRYGRHDYDLARFGLKRDELDERFAAYRERFAAYL